MHMCTCTHVSVHADMYRNPEHRIHMPQCIGDIHNIFYIILVCNTSHTRALLSTAAHENTVKAVIK